MSIFRAVAVHHSPTLRRSQHQCEAPSGRICRLARSRKPDMTAHARRSVQDARLRGRMQDVTYFLEG